MARPKCNLLYFSVLICCAIPLLLDAQRAENSTARPPNLGRYGSPVGIIGSGSTASVYLYEASQTERFAVKIFDAWDPKEHNTKQDHRREILQEYWITKSVGKHDNIVLVLDLIEEDDTWFEVMEYYPESLAAAVAQGSLSEIETQCLFKQLIDAVAQVHLHGFTHRDLKLGNLMIDLDGKLKLLDFGQAAVAYDFLEQRAVLSYGVVGTDPYMAPESFRSAKYDPRVADIWSLAMIYYAMTVRQLPWERPHIADEDFKTFASSPTLSKEFDRLPPKTISIMSKMLDINPRKRASLNDIYSDKWIQEISCFYNFANCNLRCLGLKQRRGQMLCRRWVSFLCH